MPTENTPAARSIPDFAKHHGISRAFCYNLIGQGRIVARKLGGRTIIYDADNEGFRENLPIVAPKAGALS